MKTAIIHDWLTGMRGGEKVLEQICLLYPEADIFTLIYDENAVSEIIKNHTVKTSFLRKIPGILKNYRNFLPLFPAAIESFDLAGYDLVISSSHCAAKGVRKKKGAVHFCYCHTPMRYAWDQFHNYFSAEKNGYLKYAVIKMIMPFLRKWDAAVSGRVDYYIANSGHVAKRINRYYKREANVIYPPVDTDFFTPCENTEKEDFFLVVSALTEYKKIDFVVDVFNRMPDKELRVIGAGPMFEDLKKQAQKSNISFLGSVPREVIRENYRKTRAFLFPGEEDFGITTAEAQACGAPVLAFNTGGAAEIVKEGRTGEFFDGTQEDFIKKLELIKDNVYDIEEVRGNALRFSEEIFRKNITDFIKNRTEKAGNG
ncbi:MAG: glycosyltransferase [Candidatus Goldiibacteriota bacterium]